MKLNVMLIDSDMMYSSVLSEVVEDRGFQASCFQGPEEAGVAYLMSQWFDDVVYEKGQPS